jgi:DNA-binding NarL/FixJ family response regulator
VAAGGTQPAKTKLASVDWWYAAYEARDLDGLCALAHPDIEIVPINMFSPLPGTTFRGHAGLRTLMEWSFETHPSVRLASNDTREVRGRVIAGTTFVIEEAGSEPVEFTTTTVFDIEEWRIRRVRTFANEADAIEVADEGALTSREREVFQLLAEGLTAPQIAERLVLSPATVRTHVQNGIERLGAKTRIQAISMALERGDISA